MDRLEQELRNALRRKEPSGEFTATVLARAAQQARRDSSQRRWLSRPRLRWALAAVVCLVVFAGALLSRHEQKRRQAEGEAARQQVIVALRIAGAKMQLAQAKVRHLSER